MNRYFTGTQRSVLSYFVTEPVSREVIRPAPSPVLPRVTFDIFCDGACANNGKRGAKGGMGISIRKGGMEIVSISEPLKPDEVQTNQRAELRALQIAIMYAVSQTADSIRIFTDSEYSINCITKWVSAWKRNGWLKADKSHVQHRDIIEPLSEAWSLLRGRAQIQHVSAHTGRTDSISLGNARADELATGSISHTP